MRTLLVPRFSYLGLLHGAVLRLSREMRVGNHARPSNSLSTLTTELGVSLRRSLRRKGQASFG
jgi:hypothetical protein